MAKSKKQEELEQQLSELTLDLQRTRADFENFRKRAEVDKGMARAHGRVSAINELLPLLDTIERAVAHVPAELANNNWVQGIVGLQKRLEKSLKDLGLVRISATPGTLFDPELHEAVQVDDAEGEQEVVSEELQAGYLLGETPIRHAMVKVTRQ